MLKNSHMISRHRRRTETRGGRAMGAKRGVGGRMRWAAIDDGWHSLLAAGRGDWRNELECGLSKSPVASTDEKIKSIIIIQLILQLTDYADEKNKINNIKTVSNITMFYFFKKNQ